MCGSTVDIQSAAAEIRRGMKKEEERKKDRNHRAKIQWSALLNRATITIYGSESKQHNSVKRYNYVLLIFLDPKLINDYYFWFFQVPQLTGYL